MKIKLSVTPLLQLQKSNKSRNLGYIVINNGNRTEWSPNRSVITLVDTGTLALYGLYGDVPLDRVWFWFLAPLP